MAINAKRNRTLQLPCLVCNTNGLYSKKSKVLPSQRTNGRNVKPKVANVVNSKTTCFFHPIFKNSYP